MIKHCYQLLEHSQITDIDLTLEDLNMLLALFIGKLDVSPSLTTGKYNLQSHQYVGVISLPNTKIIIEPKTKITNLNFMISKVYNLVRWQENKMAQIGTIKEWSNFVLLLFLDSLKELIIKGLNQTFQEVKENSTSIKGSIDFVKQAKENFGYNLQHYCNFTEVTANTIENQILKLALSKIYAIDELENSLIWELNKLEKYFANVSLPNLFTINFSNLTFNRLNQAYQEPIALAQMILEMSSPSLEGLSHFFPAFLIDLNRLFERFVANQLAQSCNDYNKLNKINKLILSYQMQVFLDTENKIKIIPDLILSYGEKTLAVIDTKYKLASSELNRDYYQIISYSLAQNAIYGVLVYPNWEKPKDIFYIKNSKVKILCLEVVMNKGVKELNSSIETVLETVIA
ncbi:MAG: hypothetical protein HY819_20555 [Acidobacteria bacterium]|nr:hypothetical protein [Acidobacteriota bacterium]